MSEWIRPNEFGGRHMNVPRTLPAPRCAFCGGEIRELSMTLLLWDRMAGPDETVFDGFHFAHKLECDPGRKAGDDYASSLELISQLDSPESFARFLGIALRVANKHAPLKPTLIGNLYEVVGWMSGLAMAANANCTPNDFADWQARLDDFREDAGWL